MAILSVSELRQHVETSLGNDALQRLLDGSEALIVARAGATGSATVLAFGNGRFLTLDRPAASIASIKERYTDTDEVTLAADDYLLWPGGSVIERLSGGTNSRHTWHGRTFTEYTPTDDANLRKLVQIQLVKLEIAFTPALASTTIGSWTEQYRQDKPYDEQREDILAALDPVPAMRVVG